MRFLPPAPWIAHWIKLHREQKHVRLYIPSMTRKEKEIIGYLLSHNQKLFIAAQDGGYAMPLISQGIVIRALQHGQMFDIERMPMVIPDHVWKVLVAHKDVFPSFDPNDNETPHPWRIHWMERL